MRFRKRGALCNRNDASPRQGLPGPVEGWRYDADSCPCAWIPAFPAGMTWRYTQKKRFGRPRAKWVARRGSQAPQEIRVPGVGPVLPRGEYTRHTADESAALFRFRAKRDGRGGATKLSDPDSLRPSSTPGMAEVRGPYTRPPRRYVCHRRRVLDPRRGGTRGCSSHPRRPWRRMEAIRSRGGGHESE